MVNHCLLFMQFRIHSPNIFCIDVRMENLHILNIVIISNVLEDNKWMEESFKNFRIFWNRKPIYPIIKGIQVVFQMKKFELISLEYVLLPHLQIYFAFTQVWNSEVNHSACHIADTWLCWFDQNQFDNEQRLLSCKNLFSCQYWLNTTDFTEWRKGVETKCSYFRSYFWLD